LLLGGNKQNLTTAPVDFRHGVRGFRQFALRLVQIKDVDSVALHKNVGSHVGIPLAGLVTKVYACVKQRLDVWRLGHGDWVYIHKKQPMGSRSKLRVAPVWILNKPIKKEVD
jgi:hypothetical protein